MVYAGYMVGIECAALVEAGTITAFKRHLNRYMDRKDSEGYGPKVSRWD